ncbi:MAG: hypothetical protein MJ060_01345 [Clostridia bacterium]|nr:hypothetical protein [Clostridia bacterium]
MYSNTAAPLTIETAGTYVPVNLNTTGPSADTTVAANQITINESGTYAIYYRLNVNATATESQTLTAAVFNNGSIIAPSITAINMTETTAGNYTGSLIAETIVALSAGDVLSLRLTSNTTNTVTIGSFGNATLSVKQI